MRKIKRKIQLSKTKKSYELLVAEDGKNFKVEKTNLSLEQAMKESAGIGYKNLWMDITKK